jgi:uncharacterized protein YecA (UPF0149 family)
LDRYFNRSNESICTRTVEITNLLARHWNAINSELQRTLHQPNVYLPILLEREDGVAPANDWAHGFMRAVQMGPDGWSELINDEEHGGTMVAIMMLHREHDPDPQMRPPPITREKREDMLKRMIAGLAHIYRYFEPHRRASVSMVPRASIGREGKKFGRNELCPCGSGRKYKHCCLGKPHAPLIDGLMRARIDMFPGVTPNKIHADYCVERSQSPGNFRGIVNRSLLEAPVKHRLSLRHSLTPLA